MQNGKANQQMLENGNECFYVGAKKDDNGVMLHCVKDESLIRVIVLYSFATDKVLLDMQIIWM